MFDEGSDGKPYIRGYAIALSPDGSLLAVSDLARDEIRLYEISQAD